MRGEFVTLASRLVASQPGLGAPAKQRTNWLAANLMTQFLSDATDAAFANAKPREHNTFKIQLGKLTLVRALSQAATMEL
jgi:xanthine dehydrogenase YagS FAD-binding subunit